LHQIIPFKILLCQSGRQGANHFRLSGYKSSNTKKLSDFPSHKVVIAARESRPRGELGILEQTESTRFAIVAHGCSMGIGPRASENAASPGLNWCCGGSMSHASQIGTL
jgi:hypothetical protein